MMKKKVSKAMALVMAATLMLAAVPVEANAATVEGTYEKEGTVPVSYTNESILEDPVVPGIVVKIPASIAFTEDVKEVNADVTLESIDGTYDVTKYARTATVDVSSENGYDLMYGSAALAYELSYYMEKGETTAFHALEKKAKTPETIGILGGYDSDTDTAAVTLIQGKAALTGSTTPLQVGKYTDTLTYTVTLTGSQDLDADGFEVTQ